MPRQATRRRSKKRANGEGTVTQRKDGRWQAAVYGLDGSRKFYYGATREDVNDKLIGAQSCPGRTAFAGRACHPRRVPGLLAGHI